jgi:NAD(P)-dependent dehydrogenase (short-subunit alcohol dehydrogenase family)
MTDCLCQIAVAGDESVGLKAGQLDVFGVVGVRPAKIGGDTRRFGLEYAVAKQSDVDAVVTQIDSSFYGVVNASKAVVPVLRRQGSGHIFQVSSLSARLSAPGRPTARLRSGPSLGSSAVSPKRSLRSG